MPSNVIQWFPGHMTKTKRLIRENLSLVDIVIEVLDARIPYSSKNPDIAELCASKPILTVFSKCALSDPSINGRWASYLKNKGQNPLFIDCKTGKGIDRIEPEIRRILKEKLDRYKEKGMGGMRLKAMIVGIPNVGKSTLINRMTGAVKAKAEDRPGVTTGKQWVGTNFGVDLLDTPGVLWPKFEDRSVGFHLAAVGSITDRILDTEEIAVVLCERLREICPDLLCSRYKLVRTALDGSSGEEIFEMIARKRGWILRGGEIDAERASSVILDEFRGAKIGRISLETPEFAEAHNA